MPVYAEFLGIKMDLGVSVRVCLTVLIYASLRVSGHVLCITVHLGASLYVTTGRYGEC